MIGTFYLQVMRNHQLIRSVQYLRGLAALLVVFFHFRYYLNDVYAKPDLGDALFQNGAFGVDLFFIISGFIICYATRKPEQRPLISYGMKRFFRIYPLMVISLLVFYVLFGEEHHAVGRSFLPVHADYSEKGPFFGYNMLSPVWTLTYEIFFYMLFALGLTVSQRYRKLVTLALILFLFTGLQLVINNRVETSAYTDYSYLDIAILDPIIALSSSPMILEFCFGILLYIGLTSLPDISNRARLWLNPVLLIMAGAAIVMFFLPAFYGHGPFKWGIPATLFLFSAIAYEKYNGLPNSRVLLYLGNISFSLYLVHVIILKTIRKYELDLGLTGVWAFLFAVMLSILVAIVLYQMVEDKSIQACRRLLKTINNAPLKPLAQA